MQPDSDCALVHLSSVGIYHFSTDQKFSQFEEKINLTRNVQSSNIFVIIFQNSLHKVLNCTIYPDLFKWKEMDTSPYLSGGLCRMTKHTARWSTHGSQSGNADHPPACTLLFSTVLLTGIKMRHSQHTRNCTGYKLCVLYSVRHSPQFKGVFHSFVLDCFVFSDIWTRALLSWTSSLNMVWMQCSLFNCCIAALHW